MTYARKIITTGVCKDGIQGWVATVYWRSTGEEPDIKDDDDKTECDYAIEQCQLLQKEFLEGVVTWNAQQEAAFQESENFVQEIVGTYTKGWCLDVYGEVDLRCKIGASLSIGLEQYYYELTQNPDSREPDEFDYDLMNRRGCTIHYRGETILGSYALPHPCADITRDVYTNCKEGGATFPAYPIGAGKYIISASTSIDKDKLCDHPTPEPPPDPNEKIPPCSWKVNVLVGGNSTDRFYTTNVGENFVEYNQDTVDKNGEVTSSQTFIFNVSLPSDNDCPRGVAGRIYGVNAVFTFCGCKDGEIRCGDCCIDCCGTAERLKLIIDSKKV